MTPARDRLYAAGDAPRGEFRFDGAVAQIFPDMVRRSVPGYELVVQASGMLAARFGATGGSCYDLGCSLGDGLLVARRALAPGQSCIGVDSSQPMLDACARRLQRLDALSGVELRCEDMCESDIIDAALVLMNYSLQFVPPPRRMALLRRVAAGLRPGGALLLSEKIAAADDLTQQLHYDFKRAQGYSDLEIARKREALEQVLVPDSLATHSRRLRRLGLSCTLWLRCCNFASIVAIKPS